MWPKDLGSKFQFLTGARIEMTNIEYKGNETEEGENASPINDSNDYSNFLPAVHMKYNLDNNSITHLA